MLNPAAKHPSNRFRMRFRRNYRRNKWVFWMAVPILLYYLIFHYLPMAGVVIAFKNYKPARGVLDSQWVGLRNFASFFRSPYAGRLVLNTITINALQLVFGFPAPIILALLLNEIKCMPYRRGIQTLSYLPHFISTVVICGMITEWSATKGIFNDVRALFNLTRVNVLSEAAMFRTLFVGSGIWQELGWGSIIYLATLSSADPNLYEAAVIDGAGRWKQAIHITLPTLTSLIIMQLIMRIGRMMSLGFEKIILLYTPLTYDTADVISTYIYRRGLQEANFSLGTAIGLFNSLINFILLISANALSRRIAHESLW